MSPTALPTLFALSAALALLFPAALPAQLTAHPVEELKRLVEQREKELSTAQVALAEARARLARAEGKSELASEEGRKVLAHREGRLKKVQEIYSQGRICTAEPLQAAQGAVSVTRAWLADVEGRREDLLTELPKVIAYYELRVRTYQSLLRHKAIAEDEAQEALKEFGEELHWARERLADLRGDPAGQDKTGKAGKS